MVAYIDRRTRTAIRYFSSSLTIHVLVISIFTIPLYAIYHLLFLYCCIAMQTMEDVSSEQPVPKSSPTQLFIKHVHDELILYERCPLFIFSLSLVQVFGILKKDLSNLDEEGKSKLMKDIYTTRSNSNMVVILMDYAEGKFLSYERQHFKKEKKEVRSWESYVGEKYGISVRQANRLIQFYDLISKYPRLLVVKKSFSDIVLYGKALEKYAENNPDFHALLTGPLFNVKRDDTGSYEDLHKIITGQSEEDVFMTRLSDASDNLSLEDKSKC